MPPGEPAAAFEDWPTMEPQDAGFAADVAQRVDRAFEEGELVNLHSILLARHGCLVLERYYSGEDELLGRPLGHIDFQRDTLHDMRSVSKSVVSLLYGIALSEGKVPAPAATLLDHFPAYPDLAADPGRRVWTVEHALTMRLGTEWDEFVSYADPRNSERAMDDAPDMYRYILDKPLVSEPGTKWVYNGGTTALLADLVSRGAGMPLLDYARAKLFGPLGITAVAWTLAQNGDAAAAAGLRLCPRDLAKIGQLVLNQGGWGARQLVPVDWLEQSVMRHATTSGGEGYGYQWWLGQNEPTQSPYVAGMGNGGQRLYILPALDVIVVTTAGNYNSPAGASRACD